MTIAIYKLTFADNSISFTRKNLAINEWRFIAWNMVNDGNPSEFYDYLNRGQLVDITKVSETDTNTSADKLKKIYAQYEHNMGIRVLDFK